MRILPTWLREFVDVPVDDSQLARDLTQAGIAVEGIASEDGQTAFEVEITPNRVDAMSHYGVARECAAIYDRDLKALQAELSSARPAEGGRSHTAKGAGEPSPQRAKTRLAGGPESPASTHAFPIIIDDAEGCARYCARVIREVKIAAAPGEIAARLRALGSSSISNAVDASNYTLQEMGHPTHAFDLDLLAGGKIVVRRARKGEKLKTLDGVERTLDPDDLVIADAQKPVALAGVMGGFDSMITERTRNILLESAWFDPAVIRRTVRRHGLHTDASHRFERGADWAAAPLACDRVAGLILKTAGGSLGGGLIDVVARKVGGATITLRHSEIRRHLGQEIAQQEVERILRRLGFGVSSGGVARSPSTGYPAALIIEVPSWRLDVEGEIDLIEEVARIHGYNNFPNTLPSFAGSVIELPNERKEQRVCATLLALGYHQAISLTFASQADAEKFSRARPAQLANPLNEEQAFLRTSLVPGMLNMLAWNLNRGAATAHLFESGHVFELAGELASERCDESAQLCIGATGEAFAGSMHQPARPYSFFDLKGDVEELLAEFREGAHFDSQNVPGHYHPGRSARAVLDGETVAVLGELHPAVAAERKLRQPVYLAEIDLARLFARALRQPKYGPIPRFPAIERDFSFVFADDVTFERIRFKVEDLHLAELRAFSPVEIFRGPAIGGGKYSVLLRATFQSPERTLRDDEVALAAQQIIQALQGAGGVLRG